MSVQPEPDKCPQCGGVIEATATTCGQCGAEFEYREEEDDPESYQPSGPRNRRDLEPHRGTMVLVMGIMSLVLAPCDLCVCGGLGFVAMLAGTVLSITTMVLASGDMKKMNQHLMDGRGRGSTQTGRILSIIAVCLHVVFLLLGIAIVTGFMMFARNAATMAPRGGPPIVVPVPQNAAGAPRIPPPAPPQNPPAPPKPQ